MQCILERLFDEPFGKGYPKKDALRKQADTNLLKFINSITKRELTDVIPKMDKDFMQKVVKRDNVYRYI
ncbi:hypothetical protein NSA50_15470 [Clostridium sp. DSM 100503]|uniref:hypothetical protein n=1 Tax=Clostridium sp. DSM 100503 TaxID=2963282 RepID=UPI00214A55C8|nr:hypothetical protein [Clostridium sp. DSM 100503]MCR1952428.1 hypothetical protein [Clostridium sp. DSM 100503]